MAIDRGDGDNSNHWLIDFFRLRNFDSIKNFKTQSEAPGQRSLIRGDVIQRLTETFNRKVYLLRPIKSLAKVCHSSEFVE
jgi:hypothetical protein